MNCPKCDSTEIKVVDKRNSAERKEVRRRRECLKCGERFTTYERIEKTNFLVLKKSGRMEEYDRIKLKNSILKGMKKRAISEEKIEHLLDAVEIDLLNTHRSSVIPSQDIGKAVLRHLQQLDDVAYMLYATVYLDFDCLSDIQAELQKLQNLKQE